MFCTEDANRNEKDSGAGTGRVVNKKGRQRPTLSTKPHYFTGSHQ
jgi:hypothetical protein